MAENTTTLKIRAENQTDAAFRALEANLKGMEQSFSRVSGIMATFAGGAFLTAISGIVRASEDAAVAQRKLDAVIRATGNASGYTRDQLLQLGDSLARGSMFDDEAFKEATATLLRFGNIGGENLEKVLKLSADYAALTGGDLSSAAERLGRALSNPAEGLKRLERNFGDLGPEVEGAIKAQIEMGNQSGALGIAIEALQRKIGGADQAMNQGLTGAFAQLKKNIADTAEVMGNSGATGAFSAGLERLNNAWAGLNQLLAQTDGNKLRAIAALVMNPNAFEALRALGASPIAPPTPAAGANAPQYGMGFYGPSNTEIDLERQRRAEQAKLAADWAKEQERIRQLDIRGWVAYAEAVIAESDEQFRAMADRSKAFWAEEERAKQQDLQGWVRYADEVFRQADEQNLAIAKATQERFAEQEQYWQGFLSGIEGAFRDVFDQIFRGQVNSWRDFMGVLRDIFKRTLLDFIYQSFARPFVLNVVASLAGAAGMSGLASAAGNTAAGIGGSLLGPAVGATGFGAATIAEFLAGATGTFMGPAAAGSAASMGASFAAFMTNPATLAVLAAVVIAVAVMSRRGGPKEGGSAFGTFDADGNFIPGGAPGTGNGRFYTPSGSDDAMRSMTQGIGAAFAETLARLGGGSAAGFGFGFGFDRDPRGTANSRVSGVVTDATGRSIFEVINRDAGRSEEELQEALGLIGRQSLLAALQNSQLPEAVRAILRLVDAASATADEVDAVLKLAEAFVQLQSVLTDISVADVLQRASMSSVDAFRAQGQALLELANRSSLTTESLAALAQATGAYRASAEALIVGLEGVRMQIDAMFGETRRNILMAGMGEQERYNFLQTEAARLFELLGSASTAEEIARLAEAINRNINDAFGMLSPEDQATMRDEFLTRLDNVNAQAQERLRQLQEEAAAEANRQLAEVRAIMEEMALAQQAAANTQQQAADTQLAAANTPRTFNLNVDITGGSAVVTSGG